MSMDSRVGSIFEKFEFNAHPLTLAVGWSHAKFEVTEAMRGRATGRRSVGLTVLEAKKLKSPKRVKMGIYGLHLTH